MEYPKLVAMCVWLREIGRCRSWGWKAVKRGWLHPIDIAGRPYLTEEDICRFHGRAATGEFAAPLGRAAAISSRARSSKAAKLAASKRRAHVPAGVPSHQPDMK